MTRPDDVCVIGAGGHAKVVIATLLESGLGIKAAYDDNSAKWGGSILSVPVVGPTNLLETMKSPKAVIAIGDNERRKEIAKRFSHAEWVSVIHPSACVHSTVRLGRGTVIFAGAVVQPETMIGDHCIINTSASVDHDCRIGDFVHIAPGANLAGGVVAEEGVFVGIGSAIIPYVKVGRWTVVGAGAVVHHDLDEKLLAVGVPARPLKKRK